MKKIIKLFKISFLVSCIIFGKTALAQSNVSGLIKSGPADATKLANAYLRPLFKGFGIGLNSGWNNSAITKSLGGFELRVSVSGAMVPTADKTFDVTKIGLSNNVSVASGSSNIAPTVAGKKISGPVLNVKDGSGNTIESFTLPKGGGLPIIPSPQVQATIGLPKNIDVTLRTMPKIKLGNDIGEIGMIGGGIKVDVLSMLNKTVDKVLPFSAAVAFGYTQFSYSLGLEVPVPSGSVPKTPSDSKDFDTQKISAKFSGTNVEAIISKKLLLFTPFLSVGYSSSKTDVGLKGNYPIITDAVIVGPAIVKQYTAFTDPITIKQTDISGLHSTLGFKLNLAIFRIYASYSLAEYNSFNAGIGLGLGK
jgi:hypothetical protein